MKKLKNIQQKLAKVLAIFSISIALLLGFSLNVENAIADVNITPDTDNPQLSRVNNGSENRDISEQAKNAIDNGLSVFKEATENSLEKLNPDDTTSADASKFYDPIEGREAIDRDGGR